MSPEFPHVFSPVHLGQISLKNRLVALPAGTSMAVNGVPTHEDTEHFERLAAGGAGLIIGGATVVHPTTTLRSRKLVEAYIDEFVPAARAKADVIHRHGAKFIGQLVHLGREFIGGESDAAPMAPSPMKTIRDAYPPHELTRRDIDDIIEGWRVSTENLVKAGADGVEVHAAHGYLLAQFMSPLTNQRTDEFGGSFENRMRLTHMVLDAMRSVMPQGFVLGIRLSGEEEIPGGMGIEACVQIARDLAESGVDYFSVTHGTRGKYVKDSTGPDGVAIESAARVKQATGVTTLVGQRIRDIAMAEHVLKSGKADLVGMARALIADPQLPNKAREGRLLEIRGCLGINQDCRAFDPHLHCAVNAEIGRPRHRNAGAAAAQPQRLVVVGGGPGGLEAARMAAERGHHVTVFETDTRLGGTLRIAAASPHRASMIDVVDFQERELKRLGVDVNLGAAITVDDFDDLRAMADHVVIATGSDAPDVRAGFDTLVPRSVDDVLLGRLDGVVPGRAVVFDDEDGFWPAYSAAEALAAASWSVDFVTNMTALAPRIAGESVGPLLGRLGQAGVRFHVASVVREAHGAVQIAGLFGGPALTIDADVVVVHRPRRAVNPFVHLLGDAVTAIGDCVTPRRLSHAIAEGYKVGVSV